MHASTLFIQPPLSMSHQAFGVGFIVYCELVDQRRARFVHADDFDVSAFPAKLQDDFIQRGNGRNVPKMGVGDIDAHALDGLLEVEPADEAFRRSKKYLTSDNVVTG